MDKSNGKPIYMDNLYTVTYTDGVEDEVVFEDQTYTAREGEATPAFNGDPTREGYIFAGWTPEVSETVADANVTYTATWTKVYTVTYADGAEGAAFEPKTFVVAENDETPAFDGKPVREGYEFDGWTPEVAATVTEDVTYVAVWTKLWTVTYTDGVDGEVIFADQSHTVRDGEKTPAYVGAPFAREGFLFKGWSPALAETVTADVTYVAVWTENNTGLSVPNEPQEVPPQTGMEDPVVESDEEPVETVEEPVPVDEGTASPTDIP